MKKGLRALWSCNAYIGRTWGLSPKMALWLYKRAIIPKITYVAVVWWDGMDVALARSELERLQRAACIMITGAMRTTPTKVITDFYKKNEVFKSKILIFLEKLLYFLLPTSKFVVLCSRILSNIAIVQSAIIYLIFYQPI